MSVRNVNVELLLGLEYGNFELQMKATEFVHKPRWVSPDGTNQKWKEILLDVRSRRGCR